MKNKKLLFVVTPIIKGAERLTLEKAYILGVLCGDGYITTQCRVGLGSIDKEFVEYFQYCLKKVYGIEVRLKNRNKPTNYTKTPKKQYTLLLRSKLVIEDLLKYASSFKTFEWEMPRAIKESSKEIQAMFIRGFADSEGSVKNRHRNRELILCSGNLRGLKEVRKLLWASFRINSYFVKRKTNTFVITTSDYNSLKRFHDNIGFTIRRKAEKLCAGLDYYKRKGIRKYSLGFKKLALDMLNNGYNYQEIGRILNTSYANVYDWEKADKNPEYYSKKWKKYLKKSGLKDVS